MKRWQPLTPEQLARAENRLRNPPPGSRLEAARNFGVDLTLVMEKLRMTPAERARQMHAAILAAEQVRGVARKKRP